MASVTASPITQATRPPFSLLSSSISNRSYRVK